ncbi:hypothetical protein DEFDS_0697 [Deferribacter desulfuricans SSM1]|uniref:Response regulatory domain-containing protein n=1 Tax=Deferribacter desulfuricans (strain DSM 14783 / JCM 11476 / NBRC 101012 / SSM1) TaxID=639282 RepID=D3PC54_DEFDS|nr:response regulator [Deferribacter desulfuricans]BAI80177.1 hypothetical protein DEFDS_0697 [Deferribacter desulfuricans SSM1]
MTTVLLVDDSKFIQESIKEEIEEKYKDTLIFCANNPIEAEKIMMNNIIDLLLLDVQMPIKSGNIFLKELRSLSYYTNLPIIMLTSVKDKETVIELVKLGIDGYIIKDNISQINAKIEKYIKQPSEINRLKQFTRTSTFIMLKDEWFRAIFDLLYDGDFTTLNSEEIEKINSHLKNINKHFKLSDIETEMDIRPLAAVIYNKQTSPLFSWYEVSYLQEIKEKLSGLLLGLYLYISLNDIDEENYKFIIEFILSLLIITEFCGKLKYNKEHLIEILREKYKLFYKMFIQNCPVKLKNKIEFFDNKEIKNILSSIEYISQKLFPDNMLTFNWGHKYEIEISDSYLKLLEEFYKNI